jgi:pimeloyl-ACP methyl ester carboxylesterase
MIWIACTLALFVAVALPAVALVKRNLRQSKTLAALRIESTHGIVGESFVRIGEVDQWIGIRGEHQDNPVLLVLHGGPGCSYSIFTPHLRPWEKYFTLVQWDQRGGGRTFSRMDPRGSAEISFEQLTRDTIELAEYVRARLRKDRIFLLASSLGSTFGTEVVRRRPDLFYAYIGTDQNVGMQRGRAEEHCEVLERLRVLGLQRGVRAILRELLVDVRPLAENPSLCAAEHT